MIFLGFGKYARADKIYALEPLRGDQRGGGHRTRVWVEGVPEPIVASRTERTILAEMGMDTGASSAILDDALALAERLAEAADQGKVDLGDLGRRARRLLEKTSRPGEAACVPVRRSWFSSSFTRMSSFGASTGANPMKEAIWVSL